MDEERDGDTVVLGGLAVALWLAACLLLWLCV